MPQSKLSTREHLRAVIRWMALPSWEGNLTIMILLVSSLVSIPVCLARGAREGALISILIAGITLAVLMLRAFGKALVVAIYLLYGGAMARRVMSDEWRSLAVRPLLSRTREAIAKWHSQLRQGESLINSLFG